MKQIYYFLAIGILSVLFSCGNNDTNTNKSQADTMVVINNAQKMVDSLTKVAETVTPKGTIVKTESWGDVDFTYYTNEKNEPMIVKGKYGQGFYNLYTKNNQLICADDEGTRYYFVDEKLFCYTQQNQGQMVIKPTSSEWENALLEFYNISKQNINLAQERSEPTTDEDYFGEEEGDAPQLSFYGEYTWESEKKNDAGDSEAAFSMSIVQTGLSITGGYNAYTGFGSKADQGEDDYACKIEGEVVDSIAKIKFTSCYSGETGEAEIEYKDNKWIWTVKKAAQAWCPANAILTKKM